MTYIPSKKKTTDAEFSKEFYLDKQAVFEYILDRLWEQNRQSVINNACAYIQVDGDNECRCGIGHILPPSFIGTIRNSDRNVLDVISLFRELEELSKRRISGLPARSGIYVVTDQYGNSAPFFLAMQEMHDRAGKINSDPYAPDGRDMPQDRIFRFTLLYQAALAAEQYKLDTKAIDYYRNLLGFTPA